MEFIYFLGRFHVLALHLPIGIILTVVVFDWLARSPRHRELETAVTFLWGAASVTAIATAVFGYMHFSEGGFDSTSGVLHRFFGTSVAVVTTLVWLLRTRFRAVYRKGQAFIAMLALALVTVTGHYGGNLTHGSEYLATYLPSTLRPLFGLEAERAPVRELAAADPYLDVIQPLLNRRCGTCHSDDKQRGQLNLARYETLLEGGEAGVVVVSGSPEDSDLYRRISLPEDDEDFMPAEGKTPLTPAQVRVVRWWIESGMPTGSALGSLDLPEELGSLIAAELGLTEQGRSAGQMVTQASRVVDAEAVEQLSAAGLLVRPLSQTDGRLIVSTRAPGTAVSAQSLSVLPSFTDEIVELDLTLSSLDDAALEYVAPLTNVTHLRLQENRLTDMGLQQLDGLAAVAYLNLYGNSGITDASLEMLAAMRSLRELYLWQTGVSAQGVSRLRTMRPDLTVIMGAEMVLAQDEGNNPERDQRN